MNIIKQIAVFVLFISFNVFSEDNSTYIINRFNLCTSRLEAIHQRYVNRHEIIKGEIQSKIDIKNGQIDSLTIVKTDIKNNKMLSEISKEIKKMSFKKDLNQKEYRIKIIIKIAFGRPVLINNFTTASSRVSKIEIQKDEF